MGRYLLALDAGTSGGHCLITDNRGNPLAYAEKAWSYFTPLDLAPLGKEFSPQEFWGTLCRLVREALGNAGVSPREIAGVAATAQREGMVLLDKEGRELYAGPNLDLRALGEGLALDEDWGQEIYAITGHTPSFLFAGAKLKWFQAHRPRDFERIAAILGIGDWIAYKLSGEVSCEITSAGELGLLDLCKRAWSPRLREILALPAGIFPPLIETGALVGRVTEEAAESTGLAPRTPVAAAAPDTQGGLLGLGLKAQGEGGIVAGWSVPVQMVLGFPPGEKARKLWWGCYPLPGKWVLESNAGEGGGVYGWLRQLLFPGGQEALSDRELAEGLAGTDGVMAYLGPQQMDMTRLGLRMGGFLFPVPLRDGLGRGQLLRAFWENLCFAIKANVSQLEDASKKKVSRLALGGGLARNKAFLDLLPQVLARTVLVSRVFAVSALGAAMAAATSSGLYRSLEEAMEGMAQLSPETEPTMVAVAEYEELYQRWEKASRLLQGLT